MLILFDNHCMCCVGKKQKYELSFQQISLYLVRIRLIGKECDMHIWS